MNLGKTVFVGLFVAVGLGSLACKGRTSSEELTLPDYKQAPFEKVGDAIYTPGTHPEAGPLACEVFATAGPKTPGAQAVFIFKGADGNPIYAAWLLISADVKSKTYRCYHWVDGKWTLHGEQASSTRE